MDHSIRNRDRYFSSLIWVLFLVGFCFYHASTKEAEAKAPNAEDEGYSAFTDEELQQAMKEYLGIRYKRAGESTKGFDCSGFVKVFYNRYFGVDLPHQSSEQFRYTNLEDISRDDLRTGDLIFFSTALKKKTINHVGIYFSDGKFIHSAISKGIVISQLDTSYWQSRVVGTKRLSGRNDAYLLKTALDISLSNNRQKTAFSRYEKIDYPIFSAFNLENDPDHFFPSDRFQRMEFGYVENFLPELSSQISFFRESFSMEEGYKHLNYTSISYLPERIDTTVAQAQGIRLLSDLRPSGNLFIIPSISYFEYSTEEDRGTFPKFTADLVSGVYSSSDGWSFATGLSVPISGYSSSVSGVENDDHILELTLTYCQKLSDNLSFSLQDNNFIRFIPGLEGYSSHFNTENQKFSLMLNFFY